MLGPGDTLDGFVIEAVAGRGGMGVVYRARQQEPDRLVALKLIAAAYAADQAFRARFRRESSIAAQIEHPNVIPVHAVGEADGVLYIVMRFVQGTDMRAVLAQEGRLEPRRAAAIVDAVGQALDAAHARGLVHRDVKPANVLISTAGGREHVYLSDFGLSRHIEGSQGLTGEGAFLGTIDYVAPEQARGDRVDARTDVYSLGCVLFQALTGTVPFPLDNEIAKLYAHDQSPPPSALARASELPAAFEDVLARAMAKAPEDRYLSAGDLGRAAVAAASGTALSRSERNVAVGGAAPVDAGPVQATPGTPPPPARPAPASSDETLLSPGTAATPGSTGSPPSSGAAAASTVIRPPERPSRRRPLIVAAGLAALAAVIAVVVLGMRDDSSGEDGAARRAEIPAGNLTKNSTFEDGTAGWDTFNSKIAVEAAEDAPDGANVVRVTMTRSGEAYSIDDDPDTVESSVKGTSYSAAAWVKASDPSDEKPICIAIRERSSDGASVGYADGSVNPSADAYMPVRTSHVAEGDGNRIDVFVFRDSPDLQEGDAFLVDAITMTEGSEDWASAKCAK
jgi:serine/threonine protein kinase